MSYDQFCDLAAILFLVTILILAAILFLEFVRTVHMNFYVKSGLCSSTNERVMLNLVMGAGGGAFVPVRNLSIELCALRQLITNMRKIIFLAGAKLSHSDGTAGQNTKHGSSCGA